jgi:hypothetical protein
MTTAAFIRALRRFVARRSTPSLMISDNGSTFVSAVDNIRSILKTESVKHYLANKQIQWHFMPKRAPWFWGFYERLIGLTKTTLKKVLGHACVNLDELSTVLTEIEAVINDRPLTYVASAPGEVVPLTPAHLVSGRMITPLSHTHVCADEINDPNFSPNDRTELQKRSTYLAKLFSDCWVRWRNEYLPALREQHISNSKQEGHIDGHNVNIRVGDVILVHSDNEKRVNWPLAKVTKLHYGADGMVRSADIRTKHGVTNPPITKLYPLEVNSETADTDSVTEECVNSDSVDVCHSVSARPE